MMKTIKITLLLTVIAFFMSVPNVSEAKDCSHVVKLHEKLMCKAGSGTYDSGSSTTSEKVKKEKKVKKAKKVKKERGGEDVDTLEKLMKKLKLKK